MTTPRFASRPNVRLAAAAVAATAAIAAPAVALAAKPGDLDPRFGGDGKVQRDLGVNDAGQDVVVQNDRKAVTVSTVEFRGDSAIQVNRFLANGRIDERFGNEGRRILALPGNEYLPSVALADRGKIVVSFQADTNDAPVGVARLTSRGAQDESFDGDGIQTVGFGAEIDPYRAPVDVAIAPDDDIVIAGYGAEVGAPSPRQADFAAIRLNSNGALVESFGDGGRALIDAGGDDEARAIDIDSQGRIVIAGEASVASTRQLAVARMTSEGDPDTAFAGDGGTTNELMREAEDVVAQGNTVAVTGGVSGDFGAVRLSADGSADGSFSDDGLATIDFADSTDSPTAITQDDGRLILGGSVRTQRRGFDFGVARLTPAGEPDRGFSDDGRRATDFGKGSDEASGLDVDGRGAIVVSGSVQARQNGDRSDTGLIRVLGRRR